MVVGTDSRAESPEPTESQREYTGMLTELIIRMEENVKHWRTIREKDLLFVGDNVELLTRHLELVEKMTIPDVESEAVVEEPAQEMGENLSLMSLLKVLKG